jgi:DNA-binding NarL/FixJ family response regulator
MQAIFRVAFDCTEGSSHLTLIAAAMQNGMQLSGAPPAAFPLRVFVVEDFSPVRDLIVESLAEIPGLEFAGFAEGEESALDWLSSHRCDVLILDLELRQGNGLGVLKALAAVESAAKPVKIVYSNHVSANVRRLATQFGASHFFDKTLDTPLLRVLLERLSAPAS